MSMLLRNRIVAMRVRMRRKHLNKFLSTDTTAVATTSVPACQETVMERHLKTGLPLLTQVVYKNGKIMYIHYKSNGSGIIDHLVFL